MKITNKYNLPDPYLNACLSEYKYTDKMYSVTTLSASSPRAAILQRRHHDEIISDCADMVWLVYGQAVHYFLEKHCTSFLEVKEGAMTYKTKNGYTLSGRFDLYNALEEKVSDWKTASVWKVTHKAWDDYRKQLLIYAFMLNKMGYPCKHGELVFLLKDYSKKDKRQDLNGSYPDYPIHVVNFDFTEEELNEVGEEIENYFINIEKLEKLSDADLPLCDKEYRTFNGADSWAVKKQGRKSAIRVFSTEEEANEKMESLGGTYIEHRPCEEKRCKEYCSSSPFCYHFITKYANYLVVTKEEQTRAGFLTREEAQTFINTFELENSCYIKEIKRLKEI